jgi:hypothetical protein
MLRRISRALYLRLDRSGVAMFRFLLEGHDGLALFTSLGADVQGREVLCLRFAPGAEAEVRRFLAACPAECAPEILAVRQLHSV